MQGFGSKLTAYDFLGMLIPGIVVVYCICRLFYPSVLFETVIRYTCGCKVAVSGSKTAIAQICGALIFLSASYVAGLAVNCISDLIFGRFRNNEQHINLARLRFRKRQFGTKDGSKKTFKLNRYFRLFLQIFGCRSDVYSVDAKNYCQKYYWLLNYNKLSGAIPVMEAQVAFVRNMILPTVLLAFVFFLKSDAKLMSNSVFALLLFILLCIGELAIMYARQMRVYDIVFEDFYWYKQMNDEKNTNSNH